MGQIFIPPKNSKRWSGIYPGSYYGTLWKTYNVDLDRNEGRIGLSRRMTVVADCTDTNTDTITIIRAFVKTDADCTPRYWALNANNNLYRADSNGTPTTGWITDATTNSPVTPLDFAVIGNDSRVDSGRNQLFVTTNTDIQTLNDCGDNKWDTAWWTTTQSQRALKNNMFHPIAFFFAAGQGGIGLVGDGNLLHTVTRPSDTQNDTSVYARLVLPVDLRIQHIITTANRAWLLCSNIGGGNARIAEWDGVSQKINALHDAYSRNIITGVNYKEIPIVINNNGNILEYTGNGFSQMSRGGQRIAFPVADEVDNAWSVDTTYKSGTVSPRAMTVGEDGLIYINTGNVFRNSYKQTGGIWCLNPITGRLYTKYSFGFWGDTDFGQQIPREGGAIYNFADDSGGHNFLIGGRYFRNGAQNINAAIYVLASPTNATALRGYFITQFIPADGIKDLWDTLWLRFNKFKNTADRIIVKAKGVNSLMDTSFQPLEKTITWTSATTFTVTLAAGDDALVVGDEVEVVFGVNAGILAHITTISGNHAALQTVTIDESVVDFTATSNARFDRWKKLGTISSNTVYEHALNVGITSSFLQLKVELRGISAEVDVSDLILNSKPGIYNEK